MTTRELTLQSSSGETLWGQVWEPGEKARAVLVLVHGLGDHIQRYQYVAEKLNAKDIALVGFDQQGHGKSGGKRGVINSTEGLMEDITRAVKLTKELYPDKPVFLYGHSLGGLQVLYYGLNGPERPAGIIATSPTLDGATVPPIKKLLTWLLLFTLPELMINTDLAVEGLSRDPAIGQAYRQDPLVHSMGSARLGMFMMKGSEEVKGKAESWDLPLYLAHGSADTLSPVAGSDEFAKRLNGNVTYKRWEGLYHETHNEPEKDVVIAAMLDWVEGQLS